MWEYNYSGDCPENSEIDQSDELMHYGVKGMRWGVRRWSRKLDKAKTSEQRDKAISKLEKHRKKAVREINAYQKNRVKLDDELRRSTEKDRTKAAKLEAKAAKMDQKAAKKIKKATGFFTSEERARDLMADAEVIKMRSGALHAKAATLNARYEQAKSKVESNEAMTKAFQTELSKLDDILVKQGRRYING